jgi:hypothetical protein
VNDQPIEKSGRAGKGCLIAGAVCVAAVLACAAAGLLLYGAIVARFTSPQPIKFETTPANRIHFGIAKLVLDRFRAAVADNREETIEFSAADLNALVADHPDFIAFRDRFRFVIADSAITVEVSQPLNSTSWPGLRGRWFNGKFRFTFDYEYEQFTFGPISAECAGWRLPDWLLTPEFASSFNRRFIKSVRDANEKNPRSSNLWKHIKRIDVTGNKMIITTQHI